jgi:H+/Cl- antiporter ClcA
MTAQASPSPARPATPIGPGLLGRALLTGVLAAAAATAYVVVEHDATAFLWEHLPERLGFDEAPWWWLVLLLVCGALLTAAALRLPGRGGHSPLDGFSFDAAGAVAGSLVVAAFASLSFGAVLGPEAPALAIGTATGALVAGAGRRADDPDAAMAQRGLLMMAGGMAAFGAVLGNPLALAIFILEGALVARRTAGAPVTLAPVALALAAGYVLQVGVGPWAGLGEVVLSVPTVPPYPNVLAVDLLLAVPLAVGVGVMIHVSFRSAGSFAAAVVERPRSVVLVVAALGMALLALGARAVADVPLEFVLFSGQSGLPDVVTVTSVAVVLVAAAAKLLAYVLALGSGFRGGAIFPAVFIGAALGTGVGLVVGPASVTGLVVAGTAAAVTAAIRLPFSGALLAVLLTSSAGLAVTSPALVASVVALLTVLLLDRRLGPRVVAPSTQDD